MTPKRRNGANEAPNTVSSFVALMQGPAASSFVVGQRIALEAARFWARRIHAYADQMEAFAACTSADELARVQTRFIERMRDDYAAETKVFGELVAPGTRPRGDAGERVDAA